MSRSERTAACSVTRILVVDDHHAIREGMVRLLEQQPDLHVVAAAESGEAAMECLQHQPVDLAIVDISLGQTNGLQLTGRLRSTWPELPVLVFSMHDPTVYAEKARRAGASGFVAKTNASDTLLTAIRQVLSGGLYFAGTPAQSAPDPTAPSGS